MANSKRHDTGKPRQKRQVTEERAGASDLEQGLSQQVEKSVSPRLADLAAPIPCESTNAAVSPLNTFPMVGIGASAGGLEALELLLKHMPSDTGMAFIVVTHQHPGHKSLLPELISRTTSMPVATAVDGLRIEPDHVYVALPGGQLAIRDRIFHREEITRSDSPKMPIDYFFRSLAEDQQEWAIGIVLSGTGTDGTLGLRAIKGKSGMAMVEAPQSARFSGMPASAIATNLVDYVLAPADMPKQLIAYARGPYLRGNFSPVAEDVTDIAPLQQILALLRTRTGHDFSSYKPNTLRRRIERRMNVHQIHQTGDYARFLEENPHELDSLFKELLISVTSFFRDADAWESLLTGPIVELIQSRPEGEKFRAWVPGCATGEEVYSLAIGLHECREKLQQHFDVQIFGTDLDAAAIASARLGQYPEGISVDVTAARRERYFELHDSTYHIRKEIREMAVFATQNIIRDPPFTKLDFLSCRNLLIYLNAAMQKRLLPIFHYALKPGGLLMLGTSESVGSFSHLFETVDKRWKIFRRKETPAEMFQLPEIPAQSASRTATGSLPEVSSPGVPENQIARLVERLLVTTYAPASVVVNDRADVIYIHGRTGTYLEPAPGQPRHNVLAMARPGLSIDIAAALRQAAKQTEPVVRKNIRMKTDAGEMGVDLSVSRINDPEAIRGLMLVTFTPTPQKNAGRKVKAAKAVHEDASRIADLERELQYSRESLERTVEQLKTSNEDLKSANEELQSTNEEMQSSNEELETSKEELQSLNEELTTVNSELQSKLDDLSQANDDMQNLLNSTGIATIFLDNEQNINRYTERATGLIKLRPVDIGRPIAEIVTTFQDQDLAADCRQVQTTLVPCEREVCTTDGSVYLMRILPYRTAQQAINGLVLTFVNIDRIKRAESASLELKRSLEIVESIVETIRHPLVVLDERLQVQRINSAFCRIFDSTREDTEGRLIYDLGNGQWNIPQLREMLEQILVNNSSVQDYRVDHIFPQIGRHVFLLNARRLERHDPLPGMILLAMEDVTEK